MRKKIKCLDFDFLLQYNRGLELKGTISLEK